MIKNLKSYEVELVVPFYDLDPMGIVWHGNYLKYFEIARAALFDSLGVDLYGYYKKTEYVFPIVKTFTKHIFPLKLNDKFICKATLLDDRFKIIIGFEIRHLRDKKLCTKGRSEQVAVKMSEMEMVYKIPEEIRDAFGL